MRKSKTAAVFALFLFIASSVSAFGAVRRDIGQDPSGVISPVISPTQISPIHWIVKVIKKIVKPLDEIYVPRP